MLEKIRNIIQGNVGLKLLSFLLAVLVWTAVYVQIHRGGSYGELVTARATTSRPIHVMQVSSDENFYEVIPGEAVIEVSGTKRAIRDIDNREFRVFISVTPEDVQKAETASDSQGVVTFVKKLEYIMPPEYTFVQINPPSVHILARTQNREKSGSKTNLLSIVELTNVVSTNVLDKSSMSPEKEQTP